MPEGGERIHISKSILATWQRCRLAYRFERVDRKPQAPPSLAARRGVAAHAATAELLRVGLSPNDIDDFRRASDIVLSHDLDLDDVDMLGCAAVEAAQIATSRDGRVVAIEDLVEMRRIPDVSVWARFDLVIEGGAVRPIEIIDWKFGSLATVPSAADLLNSLGVRLYRLVAGDRVRDRRLRPITLTEINPSVGTEVSVTPTDDHVTAWFSDLKRWAEEVRAARAADEFPATPGAHCRWCAYRSVCPEWGGSST